MDKQLKPAFLDVNINTDLTPLFLIGVLWFIYATRNK
jgi:hypothetical protein